MQRMLLCLLLLGALSRPQLVWAQDLPPDLVVWVRDAAGHGLAELTILVRDASGSQELARTHTDAAGRATLAAIEAHQVRVVVQGHVAGRPLVQLGQDAAGVWLTLSPRPAQLDLRVEADGVVLPDPATMLALDPVLLDQAELDQTLMATIVSVPELPRAVESGSGELQSDGLSTRDATAAAALGPSAATGRANSDSDRVGAATHADSTVGSPCPLCHCADSATDPACRELLAVEPGIASSLWPAWLLMAAFVGLAGVSGFVFWRSRGGQ
ncbi:MAG: hypothetical protein AB4911_15540 [Oscillochloridaceae bacterium umkhey_bin13]